MNANNFWIIGEMKGDVLIISIITIAMIINKTHIIEINIELLIMFFLDYFVCR